MLVKLQLNFAAPPVGGNRGIKLSSGTHLTVMTKIDPITHIQLTGGACERQPAIGRRAFMEIDVDACLHLPPSALAAQGRWYDPRVVEHKHVACAQDIWQICNEAIGNASVRLHLKQPRCVSWFSRSQGPSAGLYKGTMPDADSAHVPRRTKPWHAVNAGSPLFCLDLFHHLDFEVAFGKKLLQPRVLILEAFEFAHIAHRHPVELLAPAVNRR